MSKETFQFGLLILGQIIAILIASWKIGKWTESVNAAMKLLTSHVEDDQKKFRDLYDKYNTLAIKVAEID